MEAKASLIWANCAIELDSETSVDLDLAISILPRNPELNYTLRFSYSFKNRELLILWIFLYCRFQRFQYLENCLMKDLLMWILLNDLVVYTLYVVIQQTSLTCSD